MAAAAILAELAAFGACVVPVPLKSVGLVPAALLAFYAVAMGVNLIRGNTLLDCGCSIGSQRQPVTWTLVARNVAMAIAALVLVLPSAPRSLELLDIASLGGGVLLCAAFYATANVLIANSSYDPRGAR
jgi:hypothetical protein